MADIKELFAEGSLTAEEFEAKATEKGYKIVNLSEGNYVDKKKFDRLQSDFDKYKQEAEAARHPDYDEIVKERDKLKAEKQETELIGKVAAANVGGAFRKFVVSEVKQKVTDSVSFDDALAAYIKDNPQYVEKPGEPDSFRFPSQFAKDGGGAGGNGVADIMNKKIRAALKR